MTPAREPAGLLTLAEAADLLAEAFAEPRSDVRHRAAALAARAGGPTPVGRLAGRLRRLAEADVADADVEFARLFLAGRGAVAHPFESAHRTGRLMDPGCLAGLDDLFAAAGVRPGEGGNPADHLSAELDFLALVLRGIVDAGRGGEAHATLTAIASKLLDEHLAPFVAAYTARLDLLGPAPYFSAASELLVEVVESTSRHVALLLR